jgi:hypothetical protein
MTHHNAYFTSLQAAEAAALRGDREFTMVHLKAAMQAANKIADKQYRKLVFRAMNFARVMPTAA